MLLPAALKRLHLQMGTSHAFIIEAFPDWNGGFKAHQSPKWFRKYKNIAFYFYKTKEQLVVSLFFEIQSSPYKCDL